MGEDEGEGEGAPSHRCHHRAFAVAWREGRRMVVVVALVAYGRKVDEWARHIVVVVVGWPGMNERANEHACADGRSGVGV